MSEKRLTHPVLSDHKKVGKRFIPPFLQFANVQEVKWVDRILPELLWLGLLDNHFDWRTGAALSISLAQAASKQIQEETEEKIWFAPISNYVNLDSGQRQEVVSTLSESGELDAIREGLLPLHLFYPKCPLNFLFENMVAPIGQPEKDLDGLKNYLATVFDRRSTPATMMQADAIYIAFVTDMLKVNKGTSLDEFPKIQYYPTTEESKRIASAVRAAINGFLGGQPGYEPDSPWPSYFWNRGLELEPCALEDADDV